MNDYYMTMCDIYCSNEYDTDKDGFFYLIGSTEPSPEEEEAWKEGDKAAEEYQKYLDSEEFNTPCDYQDEEPF